MIKGDVMKRSLIFVAGAVLLAAAVLGSVRLFSGSGPSSAAASSAAAPRPCGDVALYGHVESLTPKGNHFELRFDPAWFLSGVTASRAALEDTGSSDVPNDNYVVEEGHRLLTYLVPATADISVLSRTGELPGTGFPSTAITRPSWLSSSTARSRSSWPSPSSRVSGCTRRSTPSAPSSSSTARRSP